jgi:hypothetical protein
MSPRLLLRPLLSACAAVAAGSGGAACWDFDSLSDGRADAGTDAPLPGPDTGSPGDAADGGGTIDAGDAGFCASLSPKPLFCDDFDHEQLPGQWSEQHAMNGSEQLDPMSFVSPPDSLLVQYAALAANQPLNAVLRKQLTQLPFTGLPSKLTFEVFLEPVRADMTANAISVVASVDYFDVAGDRYAMQFSQQVNAGQVVLRFEEQAQPANMGTMQVNHPLPDALPFGQFTDVRLVVMGGRAQVTYGGTVETDVALIAPTPVTPTRVQLSLGATFESTPSAGWAMRYDNVTLDATP